MSYLGNGPEDKVVLRLMARKSFALGMWIQDQNDNPLDITDATFHMVVRKTVPSTTVNDSANLITNSTGAILAPTLGFLRFELQAADLNFPPGEYMVSIVMIYEGYSSVIVNGVLELLQNTEFSSVGGIYESDDSVSTALAVALRGMTTIKVRTGPTLRPGEATFTKEDEQKLDELYAGAIADGVALNADLIPDGTEKVMMTVAEREMLANLSLNWDDIIGKPNFGTASLLNEEQIILKGGINASDDFASGEVPNTFLPLATGLRGVVVTTTAPPGGNPGYLYLKYTP